MDSPVVNIAGRLIGPEHPCFIIAEAGVNHNGSLELACELVEIAAFAGADAVKFQTFKAENVVTRDAPKAAYQQGSTDEKETHFEMVKRLELSANDHRKLIEYCGRNGIMFLSSPFDEESADLLDQLGVPAFKIPSGEIINTPYLIHIARKTKPMIVSTGMTFLGDVETAVRVIQSEGNQDIVLLHCVSNYPADPAHVNLRAMSTLSHAFNTVVGFSDHTVGVEISIAAVALGANVIEKHFTTNSNLTGPDHKASLEPDQLKEMVTSIRTVESALGNGRKEPVTSEEETADVFRKSLVAAHALQGGDILRSGMIAIKRPGTGLPPSLLPQVIGRTLRRSLDAGRIPTFEDLI